MIERCPYCKSSSIYKLGFGGDYKCNKCNKGFSMPECITTNGDKYGCLFTIIYVSLLILSIIIAVNFSYLDWNPLIVITLIFIIPLIIMILGYLLIKLVTNI
jgi:uncharacterized protein (DUF983 family)